MRLPDYTPMEPPEPIPVCEECEHWHKTKLTVDRLTGEPLYFGKCKYKDYEIREDAECCGDFLEGQNARYTPASPVSSF